MTSITADLTFLKSLTEAPSIGTACGPVINILSGRFGEEYQRALASDGFCLFQKAGASPGELRVVFVTHMDEVGGCIYGQRKEGTFDGRFWGTDNPFVYLAGAVLQGFDYLIQHEREAFPIDAQAIEVDEEFRLVFSGDKILQYRTGWTFKQETRFDDQYIYAKAVDPRVTAYAVCEAARKLDNPAVGALFVMAEECAMDVARKAVTFLSRYAPNLELVVNADVPNLLNLGDADLDLPAIRIFEGKNFIDPSFGIKVATQLINEGVKLHLSAARSGSQTILFVPLAPTLSVALPAENIHTSMGKASLLGASRCVDLLTAIGERQLSGHLAE